MPRNIRRKKPRDPSKPVDPARVIFEENRAIDEQRATHRHPDLQPLTLTALMDAFKLNGISFSAEMEGSYDCHARAWVAPYTLSCPDAELILRRTINPFDGADVLQFFRDVVCHKP